MVLLERIFVRTHNFAGLLWSRQFEEIPSERGWEKVPNWECLLVDRKQGKFSSEYMDVFKMAGKKQILAPM